MSVLRRVLAALRFLTILPVFRNVGTDPREFGRAMAYFPLIGMLIGLILSCAYMALLWAFSSLFISVLLVVLWAFLSGLLHLEGFVDAADGFSSGCDKEKVLEVMKDHHCGAKGIIALVLLIALKIALVNEVVIPLRIQALLLVPAAGRWSMVCAAYFCPYARQKDGFGKVFVENCGLREFILASIIFISAAFFILRSQAFVLVFVLSVFMFICILWLKKRIGGVTGDVLGGLNETAEVVSLAAFLFVK